MKPIPLLDLTPLTCCERRWMRAYIQSWLDWVERGGD